jgi:hypothetical protein
MSGSTILEEPDNVALTIEVGGEPIGLIQFEEECTPDYLHASTDGVWRDGRSLKSGISSGTHHSAYATRGSAFPMSSRKRRAQLYAALFSPLTKPSRQLG